MQISCFNIDVSTQKGYPIVDKYKKSVLQLHCDGWWSFINPVLINADPFLFVYNDRLYLFYEELTFRRPNGVIRMMSTSDLRKWTKPVTVIHEPEVHFSFPYVFEEEGTVYMLPECGCTHTVSLYKANNDELNSFSKCRTLIERKLSSPDVLYDYNDSCLAKKDGIYYLFTTVVRSGEKNELQLWIGSTLSGPFSPHPKSPLMINNKYGRCAGSIILKGSRLFRVAQECTNSYGENVHLLEIDVLTPSDYKEHIVIENMLPTELPFYRNGGHQLNFVNYHGQMVVATDSREWHQFIIPRTFKKIRRILNISEF